MKFSALRPLNWTLSVGSAVLLLAACGGGDDDGPTGPFGPGANSPTSESSSTRPAGVFDPKAGSCKVKITGDVEVEFEAPGGASAVGADYFFSKDELRRALAFLGPTPTDAQLNDDTPDLILLIVNCISEEGNYSLSFFPGNDSTYSDVPFGPRKYPMPPGGVLGGAGKGEFGVLASINDLTMAVSEPGEFNITAWNDDHIAGNFSFKMKEPEIFATGTPKSVSVTGDFDFDAP